MPVVDGQQLPVVSILIANFNGGALFAECIDSLKRNPQQTPFEVIVIDDASSDDSSQQAQAAMPAVTLLRNDRNLGLTRSLNRGIAASRGRYVLVLDNDTTVLTGALDHLVEYLDTNPDVGVAVSRLYNPDMSLQRTSRRFPHPLNGLFGRRSWLTKVFPNNRFVQNYMLAELENSSEPYDIDWGSTAAMMVRKQAIDQAGGLDEEFFVYWCDADWCHRIKRQGWRVSCVPASGVIHNENLKAGHRKGSRSRMIRDFHRGAWLYFRKNQLRHRYGPMGMATLGALSARAGILIVMDKLRLALASGK